MKQAHPDPKVAIIDDQNRVHMAHMDIHCGFSVNGVAALHTEILKNSELKFLLCCFTSSSRSRTAVSSWKASSFSSWAASCRQPGPIQLSIREASFGLQASQSHHPDRSPGEVAPVLY